MTFIDEHKDRADGGLRWGVESICAVLTQHDVRIAPSTYYDARGRQPSPRELSDERWKPIILATWRKQRKVLGARKLWLRLRRDEHDIARCTVERLMRDLGIAGVLRGKRKRPVDADPRETRPADLVDRHFARFRTNQLWVADGNAEVLVDSFPYAARSTAFFMMVSNSMGVNFPSRRCRRRRW
ncbi:IS3 family transposase [Microbacterium sp. LRZ72]|uniref:IS3 family transposase n=1 Tax=Microbacterium sp. LRZ72 TaxID=2942481 RepID=UPI0039B00B38